MCCKIWSGAVVMCFISVAVWGQARETTVTIGKEKIQAVKLEVDAPAREVQEAFHRHLGAGASPKKAASSSFFHENVHIPAVSQDTVDVWTRVQKNGNNSVLYMGVKDAQGNYLSGERDTAVVERLKRYLYDFARAQNYNSNDIRVGALMDSVRMDESGMQARNAEKERIQNQIRELNSQLQTLEQQLNTEKEAMELRRTRLEQMRRKTPGQQPLRDTTTQKAEQ